ncbi:hypothetical protein N5K72_004589 [Vibrio parahaemolyticus]|nr:hypothetical protein [Vibrio parahaemolyticus]
MSRYSVPSELPTDVINAHEIDAEEQQTFVDFVAKLKEEQEKNSAKYSLRYLTDNLNKAKDALIDPELKEALTLGEYEELSETVNEIKKLITKNKNSLKRKAARQEKA